MSDNIDSLILDLLRGFIARHGAPGRDALVSVSAAGAQHLRKHRHPSPR